MQTFQKDERLHGRKNIQRLFSEGKSYYTGPLKVYWAERNDDCKYPIRVLIAVSKKTIRQAVRRNMLKRRMREAYRRNKSGIYEILTRNAKQYDLGLVYTGKEIIPYQDIEKKIIQVLKRLIASHSPQDQIK
jgi:ribonuclease P protein component